mmetsp:Transcript_11414/g.32383  ORF Transcript_11414/g.32383 Transcript_11414/m.32383 type:complete len:205 (-) Transcript_11414:3238-3852(-)
MNPNPELESDGTDIAQLAPTLSKLMSLSNASDLSTVMSENMEPCESQESTELADGDAPKASPQIVEDNNASGKRPPPASSKVAERRKFHPKMGAKKTPEPSLLCRTTGPKELPEEAAAGPGQEGEEEGGEARSPVLTCHPPHIRRSHCQLHTPAPSGRPLLPLVWTFTQACTHCCLWARQRAPSPCLPSPNRRLFLTSAAAPSC